MRMKFYFKVKTKSGGIVGNILIEAKDQYEAKNKLRQRYPDCQILNCEVKQSYILSKSWLHDGIPVSLW